MRSATSCVRALFLSFLLPHKNSEDFIPLIVTAIPLFTSLRAVCVGSFQSRMDLQMYPDLAKVVREHPSIDTLSVCQMLQCGDLFRKNSSKAWKIELLYCHDNSTSVLRRPNTIKSLWLQNHEWQNLEEIWPAQIWQNLEHLDPGPDNMIYPPRNHWIILSSLRKYLDQGRRPVLGSLRLSSVHPSNLSPWLALAPDLDLDLLTYVPDYDLTIDVVKQVLDAFLKVRRLSIGLPIERQDAQFDVNLDMLGILSKLPNLERLSLTVELTYHLAITLGNDVPMFLRPIAQKLGEGCSRLRSVQLILKSEWLVTDGPLVVEYKIHRNTGMEVEILAPRLLEGTVFEFLLYR
ncbi:hypothetical protein B0H13DRAFT_524429 [Mycena leptocephala]|nr:hypothetical protein B0H13DRAFT_524429 [Mycena leptocephala]